MAAYSARLKRNKRRKAEGGRRNRQSLRTDEGRETSSMIWERAAMPARDTACSSRREGMSSFVATLSARLPSASVRLNTKIERIEPIDGQWSVAGGQSNSGSGELFDSLIIATPAAVAASLLSSVDGELARELSLIEYAGCAIAVLGYDRAQIRHPINSFGFVVPAVEGRSILSASFSSVKFPGRARDGKVLIRVFLGGALQPDLVDLPDDELLRVAADDLSDLLGIFGEPCLAKIFRWHHAMPQYHIGHLDRLKRVLERLEKLPGLALAGNAYEGVGIPQCIRSGELAAELVLRK